LPSWLHTFASADLSGRCCSPGTASCLADSQRLTGYLVYPEGLPIQMDPSSIPSYSFHGAHMECTTPCCGGSLMLKSTLVPVCVPSMTASRPRPGRPGSLLGSGTAIDDQLAPGDEG